MIHLSLPGLPPSANNAYFNLPGGGRALTTKGKNYLLSTKIALARDCPAALLQIKPDVPYALVVQLFFEELENEGWGKKKSVKYRYKNADASNRVKLLEDAFKDAAGIDDRQHMRIFLFKEQGPERTEVWVTEKDDRDGLLNLLSTLL